MGRLNWGRTEFSRGPLKSRSDVKRLAARLKAKKAPYAKDAGRFAERYWEAVLAQPIEQDKLLDIDRRYSNPRRRRKQRKAVKPRRRKANSRRRKANSRRRKVTKSRRRNPVKRHGRRFNY
jgi:uncharacterized protein with von Willebrand factor type A (vWA) domain